MGAPLGVPHRIAPLSARTEKLDAAKAAYPSTQFDTDAWYALLSADNGLFDAILHDIARFTRLRRDRGRLHLDRSGREIPEGER